MPTLMQAPREVVAALQRKLDDAECGMQYDLRLDCLSAEHKRQIKVRALPGGQPRGRLRGQAGRRRLSPVVAPERGPARATRRLF
jgi:hypothetical protein